MIAVERGPEPAALARQRAWRLAAQILARRAGRAAPALEGYEVAMQTLYTAQGERCVYCGRWEDLAAQPVEHFRPKGVADRRRRREEPPQEVDGYWWLAWTWENLFFSCTSCNSGYKRTHFPISGAPLPPLSWDPGAERALLIDPSREDPMDGIAWRPVLPERWEPEHADRSIRHLHWIPIHKSLRARVTIDLLRFSGDIARRVTVHIQDTVWPNLKPVYEAIRAGDTATARRRWRQVERALFGPNRSYPAATWDAIHFLLPEAIQTLPVKRPGRRARGWSAPAATPELPAAPAGVPEQLWLEILACGAHGAQTEKERLIVTLCELRGWSTAELEDRLPILSAEALTDYLRRLVRQRSIQERAGTFYR